MKTRHQEKAPSVEPVAQPSSQSQSQKRTSRKRRASTSSETSVQVATQESVTQNKRRKKVKEAEQVTDEPSHPQLGRLDEEADEHANSQSRRVHFDADAAEDGDHSTATNLTPHVRKQTVHRRITLSPADLRNGAKHSLKTKSRVSLPLHLTGQESPVVEGPEVDFVSLRDLIQSRVQERLQQTGDIFQIDGADDVKMEEDMMVYSGHENGVSYPKLPSSTPPNRRISSIETNELTVSKTSRDSISPGPNRSDWERSAFEDAIKRLTREASDAKAALQILQIEVQSLGFGDETTETEVVLESIRKSFTNVRERLEAALPGQLPEDLSNSELVDHVLEYLNTLAIQSAAQEQTIINNDQIRQELVSEINGLVDRLTDAEIRKSKLEAANGEFDAQGQEDEKYIHEMETKLKEIEKDHELVAAVLRQNEGQVTTLKEENTALERTIDKLGKALEKYRLAEEKLHALITRMENDHNSALIKVDNDHKGQVEVLETRIQDEVTKRNTAEADAEDKQTIITDLEVRFEEAQTLLEDYKQQLADLHESELAERNAKEQAEAERDQKDIAITKLEKKVEQAEVELEDLQDQLSQLRDLTESERRQREAAEADLDESNNKISDLDARLHKHGLEANELRQKLFEVQLREKQNIKKMEEAASEREEQFQADMADEIARREEAETLASDRSAAIADLEDQLTALEERMRTALLDKEQQIEELSDLVKKFQAENEATKAELDNAALDYQELESSTATTITKLGTTIKALENELASHAQVITALERDATTTAETHAIAIDERDDQIANLHHEIHEVREQVNDLEKEKASLERRVESEAEAMLELQASKDDDIANLKSAIRSKQAEIENLSDKATEVDQAWNNLMSEKDTEITQLSATVFERTAVITKLRGQSMNLKELFRSYVRDATATTDAMAAEIEALRNSVEDKDEMLKKRGRDLLEQVDAMEVIEEEEVAIPAKMTTTVGQHSAVKKIKKGKKSARQFDSGIGVEESFV